MILTKKNNRKVFPSHFSFDLEYGICMQLSTSFRNIVERSLPNISSRLEVNQLISLIKSFKIEEKSESPAETQLWLLSILLSQNLPDEIAPELPTFLEWMIIGLEKSALAFFHFPDTSQIVYTRNHLYQFFIIFQFFFQKKGILDAGYSAFIHMMGVSLMDKVENFLFQNIFRPVELSFNFIVQLWCFLIKHGSLEMQDRHVTFLCELLFSSRIQFPATQAQKRILRILSTFLCIIEESTKVFSPFSSSYLCYLTIGKKEIIWKKFSLNLESLEKVDFSRAAVFYHYLPLVYLPLHLNSVTVYKFLPYCLDKIRACLEDNVDEKSIVSFKSTFDFFF